MRWLLRTTFFLSLAALLLTMPLAAQQTGAVTGGLSGTVTDSSGAVVAGATVTATGPQRTKVAKTDSIGHYAFTELIPGYY